MIRITVGVFRFDAVWERERSPATCAAFAARLPFRGRLLQARWSGEAGWVPLGALDLGVGYEHPVASPSPGQLLWHPSGASEAELLVPYGVCRFASRGGPLQGNHFLTVTSGLDRLEEMGRSLMEQGPLPIVVEA